MTPTRPFWALRNQPLTYPRPHEELTMSTTDTLTALKAAEAGLARAMDSAAAELDTVGKGPLAEALARLQAAAGAARQRLAGTLAQMRAAVAGVTAELEA